MPTRTASLVRLPVALQRPKTLRLLPTRLGGKGGKCSQTNGHASDCTTLVSHNSAAISICGGTDEEGEGHDCTEVAQFASQIQQAVFEQWLGWGYLHYWAFSARGGDPLLGYH